MPKRARLSGIKALRCYTVDEAAEVVGVSARTLRSWVVDGLPAMNDDRPMLIRGDALRAFIMGQRRARKTNLAHDQFYCLSCRAARRPAGGFAECHRNGPRLMLMAICEVCETVMHKPVGQAQLTALRPHLEIMGEDPLMLSAPRAPRAEHDAERGGAAH